MHHIHELRQSDQCSQTQLRPRHQGYHAENRTAITASCATSSGKPVRRGVVIRQDIRREDYRPIFADTEQRQIALTSRLFSFQWLTRITVDDQMHQVTSLSVSCVTFLIGNSHRAAA
jgi:hypothetical protein